MTQRAFGTRSGLTVPRVNIGGMRLPGDTDAAVAVIRHAIDRGLRYIDTSRGYGDSEIKFGKALKGGYREKVILSTKWSPWVQLVEPDDKPTADCTRKRIEESMRRLDTDYLDFYQVWNVWCPENWQAATQRGGMLDGIRKAMDEGLVRHTGFTTHDTVPNLLRYIDEADWCEAILFSYNLLAPTYAPAFKAARAKGIATIVMNPVGGGKLAEPSPVLARMASEVGCHSPADLSIRYIMGNPDVDTIITGIHKKADVDDTLASAALPPLTESQMKRVDDFVEGMKPEKQGFCTACGYCKPCPQGIDIPAVMNSIFLERYWGMAGVAHYQYRGLNPKPDACTRCEECLPKCTQKLKIPDEMAYAVARLTEAPTR